MNYMRLGGLGIEESRLILRVRAAGTRVDNEFSATGGSAVAMQAIDFPE